jgi:preprotein translocase subunit SecA
MPKLDKYAQRLAGVFRQVFPRSAGSYSRKVNRILDLSAELGALDDDQIAQRVTTLRLSLSRYGARPDLTAEAFALIRAISVRTLGKAHYPVQMIGGLVLLDGQVAQMQTGEGKSLTATLAAATAAMAGIPVHIITVNEYLVTRDAEELRPLYEALGLSVAAVTADMSEAEKTAAYAKDIVYVSNKQVVFDYLRDNLALAGRQTPLRSRLAPLLVSGGEKTRRMQRGLCFGIVDEADSIFIDEARTPLIIAENADDAGEAGALYGEALDLADALVEGEDFLHHREERRIEFTNRGRRRLEGFGRTVGGLWRGRVRREDLVRTALIARLVFRRDVDYLVRDDKVHIIDEFTGRLMSDRSWEQGLHQMIETKEAVPITGLQKTKAKISYQSFFRRYVRLAGMTGTAAEVRGELWSVYRLGVVEIPTNLPSRREVLPDRVYRSEARKWKNVAFAAERAREKGRAVLIGTRTVEAAERLSQELQALNLPHVVLSARQDSEEAKIVSQAGRPGRITVATNMAGRGTDIILHPAVAKAGGLHVIMTERHEARRIDRQLIGRCGRQGDRGCVESHLSLEDHVVRSYAPAAIASVIAALAGDGGRSLLAWRLLAFSQRRAERVASRIRRNVMDVYDRLDDVLALSGKPD